MSLADQKEPGEKWKGHSGLSSGTLALNGKYVNRTLLGVGWEGGGKWNILQGESNLHQPLGAGGVLGGSVIKNPPAIQETAYNADDVGLISGSGRAPGEGHGNPLQYSGLENPMDRGVWWVTVCGVAQSQTRLSNLACTHVPVTLFPLLCRPDKSSPLINKGQPRGPGNYFT